MSLIPHYLQYVSELCEGARPAPEGICLTETDDLKKAVQLQTQIQSMGIPEFVRRCAAMTGDEIPQADYDTFDPNDLNAAIAQLASGAAESAPEQETPPVRTETRDIFEVFLDSVCLEDSLLQYLIDILRRGADDEFATLSRAAARTELRREDFLAWLGNRELLGTVDEQACVRIMDGCLSRLMAEGQTELAAALLSGDEKTFCLFRTEAPELIHLPEATYDWFCRYYLDGYYPVRFILRQNGVSFPAAQ